MAIYDRDNGIDVDPPDCSLCDDRGCESCRPDCEPDPLDDEGECIGARCTNPHPYHGSDECETVEMHEAWAAFERAQMRRERWPRIYAVVDWFCYLPTRARAAWRRLTGWRAPEVDDSEIPF